jgi:hypothetical protein
LMIDGHGQYSGNSRSAGDGASCCASGLECPAVNGVNTITASPARPPSSHHGGVCRRLS